MAETNPMRQIRVSKLIINCCVGESGDRLTKASKVLSALCKNKKPVFSKARYTVRSFGIRRDLREIILQINALYCIFYKIYYILTSNSKIIMNIHTYNKCKVNNKVLISLLL